MKKLLIISMLVLAVSVVGEIILPRLITQTFSPICFLPGVTMTSPHWLLERWIPRYNVGLIIVVVAIGAYIFLKRKLVS